MNHWTRSSYTFTFPKDKDSYFLIRPPEPNVVSVNVISTEAVVGTRMYGNNVYCSNESVVCETNTQLTFRAKGDTYGWCKPTIDKETVSNYKNFFENAVYSLILWYNILWNWIMDNKPNMDVLINLVLFCSSDIFFGETTRICWIILFVFRYCG